MNKGATKPVKNFINKDRLPYRLTKADLLEYLSEIQMDISQIFKKSSFKERTDLLKNFYCLDNAKNILNNVDEDCFKKFPLIVREIKSLASHFKTSLEKEDKRIENE